MPAKKQGSLPSSKKQQVATAQTKNNTKSQADADEKASKKSNASKSKTETKTTVKTKKSNVRGASKKQVAQSAEDDIIIDMITSAKSDEQTTSFKDNEIAKNNSDDIEQLDDIANVSSSNLESSDEMLEANSDSTDVEDGEIPEAESSEISDNLLKSSTEPADVIDEPEVNEETTITRNEPKKVIEADVVDIEVIPLKNEQKSTSTKNEDEVNHPLYASKADLMTIQSLLDKILQMQDSFKTQIAELKIESGKLRNEIASLRIEHNKLASTINANPPLQQSTAMVHPTTQHAPSSSPIAKTNFNSLEILGLTTPRKVSNLPIDFMTFGFYPQNRLDDNEKEWQRQPIEWMILDKVEVPNPNFPNQMITRALLLSKYALDCMPFSESDPSVDWESSSIRTWLNGKFFTNAFPIEDQKYIVRQLLAPAPDLPHYRKTDRIFLLSPSEVKMYLPIDLDRQCKVTDYARSKGVDVRIKGVDEKKSFFAGRWWLRSPDNITPDTIGTAAINSTGMCYNMPVTGLCYTNVAIRPAMWINLR